MSTHELASIQQRKSISGARAKPGDSTTSACASFANATHAASADRATPATLRHPTAPIRRASLQQRRHPLLQRLVIQLQRCLDALVVAAEARVLDRLRVPPQRLDVLGREYVVLAVRLQRGGAQTERVMHTWERRSDRGMTRLSGEMPRQTRERGQRCCGRESDIMPHGSTSCA